MLFRSEDEILELIIQKFIGKKISILSPVVKSRKGHYRELFSSIIKQGFIKTRVDGEIKDLTPGFKLDRYKTHDIEIVVDRMSLRSEESCYKRLKESITTALYHGNDSLLIINEDNNESSYFSKSLICPSSGISYEKPEPNSFSLDRKSTRLNSSHSSVSRMPSSA